MKRRLAPLFLIAIAVGAALVTGATAAAASPAAVGSAAVLKRSQARQATSRTACPAALGLNAPVAAQESAMRCLVDETRAHYGLPALAQSPALTQSAVDKGADLLRCNEFSHTACGREFTYWIDESGYMATECWRVGENLAWGVDDQGTVGSIFRAWMHSPAHRANILGNYEETGIDLRIGQLGGLTGVHLWTQHFGSHCEAQS
jgi:uncharacterized protein YkwD